MAAVLDYGSNFQVKVAKSSSHSVGYKIGIEIHVSTKHPTAMGFLDEWCETHGLNHTVREWSDKLRLEVARREDVERLLRLVRPYLIARYEASELILTELIPALNERLPSTKEGFIETMDTVDEIRNHLKDANSKYDVDYFWNEWDMDSR